MQPQSSKVPDCRYGKPYYLGRKQRPPRSYSTVGKYHNCLVNLDVPCCTATGTLSHSRGGTGWSRDSAAEPSLEHWLTPYHTPTLCSCEHTTFRMDSYVTTLPSTKIKGHSYLLLPHSATLYVSNQKTVAVTDNAWLSVRMVFRLSRCMRLWPQCLLPLRYHNNSNFSVLSISMNSMLLNKRRRMSYDMEMKEDGAAIEHCVGSSNSVKPGSMKECTIGDNSVLVGRKANGDLFCTSAKCTHYGAPLAQGVLAGDTIVCPWHSACFNCSTGDIEDAPALVRQAWPSCFFALPLTVQLFAGLTHDHHV